MRKTFKLEELDCANCGAKIEAGIKQIEGVNDAPADLKALQKFCSNLLCHVNLIPINAIEGSEFQPSSPETINLWLSEISKKGTEATLRDSRGSDISGAVAN